MIKRKILTCLILVPVLLLCGCGDSLTQMISDNYTDEHQVKKEQTIGDNFKWINSSIPGAIDENTEVSLKDDFYTAVNKDRLLSIKLSDDYGTCFDRYYDVVLNRKIMIATGQDDPEAIASSDIEIDAASLEHDKELVEMFSIAADDWESRNKLGSEPIFEYIRAIEDIKSMEDMNEYVLNTNGTNFAGKSLVSITADSILADPTVYSVVLGSEVYYALASREQYMSIDYTGIINDHLVKNEVISVLTQMGYSEKDAEDVVRRCYELEYKLADASLPSSVKNKESHYSDKEEYYSLDDVRNMQGNYPICELLEKYGYTAAGQYYIQDDELIRKIGKIYCEANLERIKSYYIVHTIQEAMPLLDKASYDVAKEFEKKNGETVDLSITDADGDDNRLSIDKEGNALLDDYVEKYLKEPLEIVYISKYCSSEDKEYLTGITNDLVAYYKQMITEEDWLSDEFKAFANEKLDFLKKHILYPDRFDDYYEIQFEEGDTLIDMVCKIKESDRLHEAALAGRKVDAVDWDLKDIPTTTVNAYYIPGQNSINIFAGIIAGTEMYDRNQPYEYNLAKIGTMIGHEISHGFDSNGIMFDKYGNGGFNADYAVDVAKFSDKTKKLVSFYDTISPAPGIPTMTGTIVKNEVIADLGGVKAALAVGKTKGEFDYDLFFRSYADEWCEKVSYSDLSIISRSEEHPCGMLRTNVTLSQMPEFIEFYEIKKGDGMYVAPEDRIGLW